MACGFLGFNKRVNGGALWGRTARGEQVWEGNRELRFGYVPCGTPVSHPSADAQQAAEGKVLEIRGWWGWQVWEPLGYGWLLNPYDALTPSVRLPQLPHPACQGRALCTQCSVATLCTRPSGCCIWMGGRPTLWVHSGLIPRDAWGTLQGSVPTATLVPSACTAPTVLRAMDWSLYDRVHMFIFHIHH